MSTVTFQVTHCRVVSVAQTHAGTIEVIKEYALETPVSKKEIYAAINGRVELVAVEDVIEGNDTAPITE